MLYLLLVTSAKIHARHPLTAQEFLFWLQEISGHLPIMVMN